MSYINIEKTYRRRLVQKLLDQNESDATISHLTEYSESHIRTLRLKHKKREDISILRKPGGSVCRLSNENIEQLREILAAGANSYSLEGDFWDRKRIKYVIEQEFNVNYDLEHISDIAAKINFTLQKPVKKDFRQNEESVQIWTQTTLPNIKKKLR